MIEDSVERITWIGSQNFYSKYWKQSRFNKKNMCKYGLIEYNANLAYECHEKPDPIQDHSYTTVTYDTNPEIWILRRSVSILYGGTKDMRLLKNLCADVNQIWQSLIYEPKSYFYLQNTKKFPGLERMCHTK